MTRSIERERSVLIPDGVRAACGQCYSQGGTAGPGESPQSWQATKVIEAENGERAIELFREAAGEIDALVLDAIMPVCDGWRAYLEMERMKPGIKALFTTDCAANVLPSDFSGSGARLLSKPFKPGELLAKLSELLSSGPART